MIALIAKAINNNHFQSLTIMYNYFQSLLTPNDPTSYVLCPTSYVLCPTSFFISSTLHKTRLHLIKILFAVGQDTEHIVCLDHSGATRTYKLAIPLDDDDER